MAVLDVGEYWTMGLRETIDKYPKVTVGVVGGVAVVALMISLLNVFASGSTSPGTKEFFTDDDGKTWFADNVNRAPPFDHNGKEAVRAKVFTCDDHKTSFVGYLERYSPAMKKRIEAAQAATTPGKLASISRYSPEATMGGTEVKRPGESTWVSGGNMAARDKVTNVVCPSGGVLDSVSP